MKHTNLRIIPLMLVLVLVISLVGCGKNKNDNVPTSGDYTYQGYQYSFEGISGDVSMTDESGSDTDDTGKVYNKGSGSYGSKNPGYIRPPAQNNNGSNKNNGGSYDSNSGKYLTTDEILAIVKGSADTFDEAIRILNEKGIYPSEIAKKAMEAYYKVSNSIKNDYASQIQGGISNIYGKLTEYASNRATTAAPTKPAE